MGFSTIGSFIIMFFAILIMISSAVLIYSSLVESTNTATEVQKERIENMISTRIDIINIVFENNTDPDTTAVYVSNDGSKKLDLDYVDVFIDAIKIPRSSANRTIMFVNDTNIVNPLHWDPDEIIEINVSLDLEDKQRTANSE